MAGIFFHWLIDGSHLRPILAEPGAKGYFREMTKMTAILHLGEPEEGGFWATCLEVPGANGQGETREECLENLRSAVRDILHINRSEAVADDPAAELMDLLIP
jgi:predicted RNase H-like HicB family nuclease